jgi:hypothetical protein
VMSAIATQYNVVTTQQQLNATFTDHRHKTKHSKQRMSSSKYASSSSSPPPSLNMVNNKKPSPEMSSKMSSEIHELAKGWKAAIARAKDPATRHEARIKNDRGNLPLHSAASFRAPLEVAGMCIYICIYIIVLCCIALYCTVYCIVLYCN